MTILNISGPDQDITPVRAASRPTALVDITDAYRDLYGTLALIIAYTASLETQVADTRTAKIRALIAAAVLGFLLAGTGAAALLTFA